MQKYRPCRSYVATIGHLPQLHPNILISLAGFSEEPRAQKSAFGGDFISSFGLNEGHGPQYFLQMFKCSSSFGTPSLDISDHHS
jgi:hypothetical protein